jgi:DNA-binding response OmpR family regulator
VPYRIVVADPSPSVQKAAQMVFPEPDFKLFFFDDGRDLDASLPGIGADAVLLALSLAGADPYEIGREITGRKGFENAPLFFLKGTFEAFDPEKADGIPYDGVIQKPFDSEGMAAIVREAIDRKASPPTMPEEPVWDGPAESLPIHGEEPGGGLPTPGRVPDSLQPRIRELVRSEALEIEREIEKRVRTRVLADLKEWLASQGNKPHS